MIVSRRDKYNPVSDYLGDGWAYDGHLTESLDRESDFTEDTRLDRSYEYISVSVSLKRKRKVEDHSC